MDFGFKYFHNFQIYIFPIDTCKLLILFDAIYDWLNGLIFS